MITMDKAYILVVVDKDRLKPKLRGKYTSVRKFIDSPFAVTRQMLDATPIFNATQVYKLTQEQIDAVNAVVSIDEGDEK